MSDNRPIQTSEHSDCKRVLAFLTKTRGLDYNTVLDLVKQGKIAQEEKTGNALFKYFDENGELVGVEKVGTSTEHKFKGIASGSNSDYGFEVVRGNGEKAYFFESAIDMLSFMQMNRDIDNARFVSMMGVKPNVVFETLMRNNINPNSVYICSDNDEAGNRFYEDITEENTPMESFHRIKTPDNFKDWNDMLRGIEKDKEVEKVADRPTRSDKIWFNMTDKEDILKVNISKAQLEMLAEEFDKYQLSFAASSKDDEAIFYIDKKSESAVKLVNLLIDGAELSAVGKGKETALNYNNNYSRNTESAEISLRSDIIFRAAKAASEQGIKFELAADGDSGNIKMAFDEADISRLGKIVSDIKQARTKLPKRIEELERAAERAQQAELERITAEISGMKKDFAENIADKSSGEIMSFARELKELEKQQAELKEKVHGRAITKSDIAKLREVQPPKISVQNMLETDVAKTSKFEGFLEQELGDTSPYVQREQADIINDENHSQDEQLVHIIDVAERHSNFKTTRDAIKTNEIMRGEVTNLSSGISVQVSRAGLEDSVFYANKHKDNVTFDMLYNIEDIIKHSVLLDTTLTDDNNNHKAQNTMFMHALYSVAKIGNEHYLTKAAVEEFLAQENITKFRLYNIQSIKIEPSRHVGFGDNNHVAPSVLNGSDISIAQLRAFVKTYDKNFFENEQAVGRQARLDEIAVNNTVGKAIDEAQKTAEKEMTGLFSLEQNGELRYYKTDSKANELLKTAKSSEHAFIDLAKMGTQITEAEYAEIEQSDRVKYSADFNLDRQTADITAINNGRGGIAENDRKDSDVVVYTQRLKKIEVSRAAEQPAAEDKPSKPEIKAPITKEMYHVDTAEIHESHDKNADYILARIEIDTSDELYARLAEHGVKPMEHSLDKVILETDNENWFSLAIPDSFGNIYNNVPAAEVFTPAEMSAAREAAEEVIGGHIERTQDQQFSFDTQDRITEAPDFSDLIDIEKLTVNGDTVYWEYFNEDGNDGKGQLVELTFTADDISEALIAVEAAGDVSEGYRAYLFTNYIEERSSQTMIDYGTEDFEAAKEHFINGEHDFTVSGADSSREITKFLTDAFPQRVEEREESAIIEDFKAKTDEYFHDIDGNSAEEIEALVREHAEAVFAENGIEAAVKGVVLDGSRSRGIEHYSSDIDVVMEIESELKEDALFNILHENELTVGRIAVDVNPIKADESGTLEEYLPKAEEYLKNKAHEAAVEQEQPTAPDIAETNNTLRGIDAETAVLMWENGFDVFVDGEKLPEYVAGGENWEFVERINNSGTVQAAPADMKKSRR